MSKPLFRITLRDKKARRDPKVRVWLREVEKQVSEAVLAQQADLQIYGVGVLDRKMVRRIGCSR